MIRQTVLSVRKNMIFSEMHVWNYPVQLIISHLSKGRRLNVRNMTVSLCSSHSFGFSDFVVLSVAASFDHVIVSQVDHVVPDC